MIPAQGDAGFILNYSCCSWFATRQTKWADLFMLFCLNLQLAAALNDNFPLCGQRVPLTARVQMAALVARTHAATSILAIKKPAACCLVSNCICFQFICMKRTNKRKVSLLKQTRTAKYK